jgi:site-specific recombinase XerC
VHWSKQKGLDYITVMNAASTGKASVPTEEDLFLADWCALFNHPEFVEIPAPLRAVLLVRWGLDKPLMCLFRMIAEYVSRMDERRALLYMEFVRLLYDLCALLPQGGSVSNQLKSMDRTGMINMISQNGSQKMKKNVSRFFYQFTRTRPLAHCIPEWNDWQPINPRDVGYNTKKRTREKTVFSESEIDRLLDISKASPRDEALMRFYLHTGCRSSAAVELLVKDIWDANTGTILKEGTVLEKFNQMFKFPIDQALGAALQTWLARSGVQKYVFPCVKNNKRQWSHHSGPHKWLRGLCNRAGIKGSHVHVHALRRVSISVDRVLCE